MAEYIYDISHIILERFIKKSIMEKATPMAKLAKVDVIKKKNLVHAKNVDIGFATKKIIRDMQTKKKPSDRQVFHFQNECFMVAKPEQAIQRMTQMLEKLMNLKH